MLSKKVCKENISMDWKLVSLVAGSSLVIGLGIGTGMTASGKPFILEMTNTPVGSFVFRGNMIYILPLPDALTPKSKQLFWLEQIA